MQKLAREYLDELNKRHRKNRKAILAWVLLAVLVISTVAGGLTQYGSALTEKYPCSTLPYFPIQK